MRLFKLKVSNQKLNYEFNFKPEPIFYKGASWNVQSLK